MSNITLTKGNNTNKAINSICRSCKRDTRHLIITDVSLHGTEGEEQYCEFQWNSEYQIISCQGCNTISFRKTYENSEDITQVGVNEWETDTKIDIYPDPKETRKAIDEDWRIPTNLQRIYLETLQSFNSNLKIMTGIGVRAIIETVCRDNSATGGNLYAKINSLVTQGVLTQDGANILHKLRILGNDAAHEVKPHSIAQLGLAMDVIDHILQGIYILPDQIINTFN